MHLGLTVCLSGCITKKNTIAPIDLILLYKKCYPHGSVLL